MVVILIVNGYKMKRNTAKIIKFKELLLSGIANVEKCIEVRFSNTNTAKNFQKEDQQAFFSALQKIIEEKESHDSNYIDSLITTINSNADLIELLGSNNLDLIHDN